MPLHRSSAFRVKLRQEMLWRSPEILFPQNR